MHTHNLMVYVIHFGEQHRGFEVACKKEIVHNVHIHNRLGYSKVLNTSLEVGCNGGTQLR